jgi:hypothetical protein
MSVELFVNVEDQKSVKARLRTEDGEYDANGMIRIDPLRDATLDVLEAWIRDGRFKHRREFELLGMHLYDTVFGDKPISDIFKKAMDEVPNKERLLLRLTFNEQARSLGQRPWEYLYYRGEDSFFFSTGVNLVLSRYYSRIGLPKLEPIDGPVKFLVIVSRTALGKVDDAPVIDALQRLSERYPLQLEYERMENLSTNDLANVLNDDAKMFHVIHFVGHGRYRNGTNQGELALVEPDGKTLRWVSDKVIAEIFENEAHTLPRFVFLQLCKPGDDQFGPDDIANTVSLAQPLLEKDIPSVLAMHFPIGDDDAGLFSENLYADLLKGLHVDYAVQRARARLVFNTARQYDDRLFGTPVLYLRSNAPLVRTPAEAGRFTSERAAVPRDPTPLVEDVTQPIAAGRQP